MSTAHILSAAEFASLEQIGAGHFLGVTIPSDHLLKLIGLRYIEAVHGHYEATTAGRFRIASGN
jgi:hypothetical protein